MPMWNEIAQALRDVDGGSSNGTREWPVEAVVHAGLRGSTDFAEALGVHGPGTWVAGRNGVADSTRILDEAPVAGVEVKFNAKENVADYKCPHGCTRQLEHLAHQGTFLLVTTSERAGRDRSAWPSSARVVTLAELAEIMDQSAAPTDASLVRALFGLPSSVE